MEQARLPRLPTDSFLFARFRTWIPMRYDGFETSKRNKRNQQVASSAGSTLRSATLTQSEINARVAHHSHNLSFLGAVSAQIARNRDSCWLIQKLSTSNPTSRAPDRMS